MADSTPPERLPIKLVLPKQGAERPVPAGGSKAVPFRTVDGAYRTRLSNQVDAIHKAAVAEVGPNGSVPVRMRLIPKATAKSHLPMTLMAECPLIGVGKLGELFLKGTAPGLSHLSKRIQTNDSQQTLKELSAIESIEPVTPLFRRRGMQPKDILKRSPKTKEGWLVRVRLFDFGFASEPDEAKSTFEDLCKKRRLVWNAGGYAPSTRVYAVECRTEEDVEALSRTVGVRSISRMPLIHVALSNDPKPSAEAAPLPNATDSDGEFPVVVVVDSGVSRLNPELNSWVVGRDSDVAPAYSNLTHGTFVAGLIAFGSRLNPSIPNIDDSPCGVFDLQLIPNWDPEYGDIETLPESAFLASLEKNLQRLSDKYKVWNLSVGSDDVCSLDEFSPFAEQLDNLQEKYGVSFVISAGNYDVLPMLDYPRPASLMAAGRITCPADSVLGITVGSVGHADSPKGPAQHHPAPYSRHGAGPNHIIKPDVVHYGGACSTDGTWRSGISSLNEAGPVRDVGTSFATPLVSKTLAQIYHRITPRPSPMLARALLTHHARDPRTGGRVPDGEENFLGFGIPAATPTCLECTPHSATLVFEDSLRPGFYLEWDQFPYPPSLHRGGKYYGEIGMTLAFAPPRGSRWGTEYCEAHIEASFGVYYRKKSRETGAVSNVFKGLVPPEHKNTSILYESYQVEKLVPVPRITLVTEEAA